jgi:Polyketide cyclase / dehydrase and lipid transport
MTGFSGTATINRPIEVVFDFLAAGVNDPTFSPRVLEIKKATDGPVGVGTVFESTVKDAGMKSKRSFAYTSFERPTSLRWSEQSKNLITVPDGGYDLEALGPDQTKLTVHNEFAGHGLGKLLLKPAVKAAQKDADAFAGRIKAAVEAAG